jgi:hypothetical protein
LDHDTRQRIWLLYGWFTGLMCCGSCIGAVTWAAWMQFLLAYYRSNDITIRHKAEVEWESARVSCLLYAPRAFAHAHVHACLFVPACAASRCRVTHVQSFRWLAVFFIAESCAFCCLVIAKLLVLERMKGFVARKAAGMPRWWASGSRVLVAAAVCLNFVGACGSVGASVYSARAAGFYSAAAANSTDYQNQITEGNHLSQIAASVAAIPLGCELVVLLLIVLAFSVVGCASVRRVNAAMSSMAASDGRASQVHVKGQQLQRQIVGTVAVVFVSFLMRVVYSIMFALANGLQNSGSTCPDNSGLCDPICHNVYSQIQGWLLYTPEFEILIVLISQPVALIIALWGMTSGHMLELMKGEGLPQQHRLLNTM